MSFAFTTPLDERVPMPLWYAPTYAGLLTFSILFPKSVRVAVFLPLATYLLSWFPKYTFFTFGTTYLIAIPLIGLLWQYIDFAILNDPEVAFFKVKEPITDAKSLAKAKAEGSMPKDTIGKLTWATEFLTNNRGIGWNWQVKNVPEAPVQSRCQFVFWSGMRSIYWLCMLDLSYWLMHRSPYSGFGDQLPFYGAPWTHRFTVMLGGCWWLRYLLNGGYEVITFICVGSGLFPQTAFPPLMGSMFNANTVRNFWGREWHQLVRRIVSTPGNLIRKGLRIPKGSFLSRYSQLYMGFAFSAVLHSAGGYNISRHTVNDPWWFMSFAAAISIEDFIMYLGQKCGIKYNAFVHVIGCLWVMYVFYFTLEWSGFASCLLDVGFAAEKGWSLTQTIIDFLAQYGINADLWSHLGA